MVALDGLGLALAFASSAADACHEAAQKAMATFMPNPELALALKSGIIALVFLASYFQQQEDAWAQLLVTFTRADFLTAWLVAGSINVGANFLMILGMKRGKMSDTVPFLSLSPVFLLASGYFLLGELADGKGMAGVLVIAVGGFWLSRTGAAREDDAPQKKSSFKSLPPGAGIYIFIAMIQSVSSAFDKRGVRAAAAPILYGATISGTVAACALFKFTWLEYLARSREPGFVAVDPADPVAAAALAVKSASEHSKFDALSKALSEADKVSQQSSVDADPAPMQRQTSPKSEQSSPQMSRQASPQMLGKRSASKGMRRNSSSFMADLMAPDIWEEVVADDDMCPETMPMQQEASLKEGQESEIKRQASSDSDALSDISEDTPPPPPLQMQATSSMITKRRGSFLSTDVWQTVAEGEGSADPDAVTSQAFQKVDSFQPGIRFGARRSSLFRAPDAQAPEECTCAEAKEKKTSSFLMRWGLMLLACALKMIAYWCQLKANERIYSSHLSAIRKSGVLLVLLLGRVLFNEEIGSKLLPVGTMLAGVAILAAK